MLEIVNIVDLFFQNMFFYVKFDVELRISELAMSKFDIAMSKKHWFCSIYTGTAQIDV